MALAGTGAELQHVVPRPNKLAYDNNYLSIADNDFNFAKQFLPEVYEKEVERYGNRTISGFLRMVGAEMPMASDEVVWTEQGRIHVASNNATIANVGAGQDRITLVNDPGTSGATDQVFQQATEQIKLYSEGDTVVISQGNKTVKARISGFGGGGVTFDVAAYGHDKIVGNGGNDAGFSAAAVKLFIYGSEYAKGTDNDKQKSVDAPFRKFTNKPIILKGKYEISGSDTAQIGWVEVATEAGASGYLWYLKSESETRIRFEDKLEMAMIEAEKAVAASGLAGTQTTGSEGLFSAVESRGLVYNDQNFGNANADAGILEFDNILQELDKQGAIEENMMFLDRATALSIDKMLANQNSYGEGGTSYGVFDNSEDMALNLGFSGFRRGSYDFYKSDWKYLNDSTTRGLIADIEGIMVPAGTSTVYDQSLGRNISRPFLHCRYRASEADDRRMKSWITGSVGGNFTSALDVMTVNFLSERCLCVQAANNFVLLKKS
mgnify:FL=1|tara:strand:+ start:4922 stop:6397 length:1476 start_codon:yes stop_codon:yes gene_type:complete